jgi:hypothetical protein
MNILNSFVNDSCNFFATISLAGATWICRHQVHNSFVDWMDVNHPQQLRFSRWRDVDMPTLGGQCPSLVN